MADIIKSEDNIAIRIADIGDGTYAEVTSTNSFSSGANFNVVGSGKSLTSTGTSVSTILPFDSVSLLAPSCVRVSVTDSGYIRIKETEASATATDILVNTDDSLLIDVEGKKFISFLSVGVSATANIQPVSGSSFDIFPSTLNLNFTTNAYKINNTPITLSNLITFTRASSASFIDNDGLVKFSAANTPRIEYDPITLQSKGILIEESRTNLLNYSEMVGETIWAKNDCSVTLNSSVAPDGTTTADKIVENSATAAHFLQQAITAVAGTSYTSSFFVKAAERSFCFVGFSGAGLGDVLVGVNLTTGAVVSTLNSPDATSVTQLPNGWFRISLRKAASSSSALGARVYSSTDGQVANRSYAGDGASGVLVWGAQLETGGFLTSYIQTAATTATRSADVAKIDGSNFASFFNRNEGTFYAEVTTAANNTIVQRLFEVSSLDQTSRTSMRRTGSGTIAQFYIRGGTSQADVGSVQVYAGSSQVKAASAYKTNDFVMVADGVVGGTDSTGDIMINPVQMYLGTESNGLASLNGYIRKIMYMPQRLTNAELQALSS